MSETAEKAKSLFERAKPYHDDARRTLPVLVRQARAGETIHYNTLAAEVGVNGARNLAYPLGCIGQTLLELGLRWEERIPALQTLAVNKASGLPGGGIAHFTPNPKAFAKAPRWERQRIVREMLRDVFAYDQWDRVLNELGLEPCSVPQLDPARMSFRGGTGESREHRALKDLIASHPELVGATGMSGQTEARLLSGDLVDVLFRSSRRVLAVEVKSERSPLDDVIRGIFQCVKYQAVLESEDKVPGIHRRIDSLLVLGGPLSPDARGIANTLGVQVLDRIVT